MTISAALRKQLLATPAISSIVGTRIWPNRLPQTGQYPSITYNLSLEPLEQMGTVPAVMQGHGALMCFALDYDAADALAQSVYDALEHFSGTMGGAGGVTVIGTLVSNISPATDDLIPGESVCTSTVDFQINYAA